MLVEMEMERERVTGTLWWWWVRGDCVVVVEEYDGGREGRGEGRTL